jgi:hypothetical protein
MKHTFGVSLDQVLIVTGLDLLDQRPSSQQRLEEPFRSRLVTELEGSLVNRHRFTLYMRALDNVLGKRKPVAANIGEDAHNSVLNNGLAGLSDHELLRLALDGPALWALHLCIKGDGGSYWKTVAEAVSVAQEPQQALPSASDQQTKPLPRTTAGRSNDKQLIVPAPTGSDPVGGKDEKSADFLDPLPTIAARCKPPSSRCPLTGDPQAEPDSPAKRNQSVAPGVPATDPVRKETRTPSSEIFVDLAARRASASSDHTSRKFGPLYINDSPFAILWRGSSYPVLSDADGDLYVAVPSGATHVRVGSVSYHLEKCDRPEFVIRGLSNARLRRCVKEQGDLITFWSEDSEGEP